MSAEGKRSAHRQGLTITSLRCRSDLTFSKEEGGSSSTGLHQLKTAGSILKIMFVVIVAFNIK